MKILITMSGMGSRFRNIGFTIPKHEIIAKDKTLFEWSLLSLQDFFEDEFIFIVRKDNYNMQFIEEKCSNLGIDKYSVLEIDRMTDGQAETALLADELINDGDEVAIFNIDTFIEPNTIKKEQIQANYDGFIPSFVAEGDKWSFVKLGKKNRVTEVSEKVRISEYGTIGFYYFRNWSEYKRIYNEYKDQIIADFKEVYIAPMYKYMIEADQGVYASIMPKDSFYVLGTPEDIEGFDKNYLEKQEDKSPYIKGLIMNMKFNEAIAYYESILDENLEYIYEFIKLLGDIGRVDLIEYYCEKYNVEALVKDKAFFRRDINLAKHIAKHVTSKLVAGKMIYTDKKVNDLMTLANSDAKALQSYFKYQKEKIFVETKHPYYEQALMYSLHVLIENNLLTKGIAKAYITYIPESGIFARQCVKYIIATIIDYMDGRNPEFFGFTRRYSYYQKIHFLLTEHYKHYEPGIRRYQKLLYANCNIESNDKENTKVVYKSKKDKSEKPRIALCISGMARGDQDLYNEEIKKRIVEKLDADVFIHTWDIKQLYPGFGGVGTASDARDWQRKYYTTTQNSCPEEIKLEGGFKQYLPNVYDRLNTPINVQNSEEYYKQYFPNAKVVIDKQADFDAKYADVEGYQRRGHINSLKMFYGIWKSQQMATEYMNENGFEYDYIIRFRTDTLVVEDLDFDRFLELDSNQLCCSFHKTVGPQDMIFFGGYDTMMKVGNIFARAIENENISPLLYAGNSDEFDAHKLLFSTLIYENVFAKPEKFIKYKAMRLIPVPSLDEALEKDLVNLPENQQKKFKAFFDKFPEAYGTIKE